MAAKKWAYGKAKDKRNSKHLMKLFEIILDFLNFKNIV